MLRDLLILLVTFLSTVEAGQLKLMGESSQIAMNGAVLQAKCANSKAMVSFIQPQDFFGAFPTDRSVHVELIGVPVSCAGLSIYTPCANPINARPAAFFCSWMGPQGVQTIGPVNATRYDDPSDTDAAISHGVGVALRCPLPTQAEVVSIAPAQGEDSKIPTNEIPTNEIPTDEISTNEIPANEIPANEIPTNEMSANENPAIEE
jgi:hypothetical protein